MISTCQFFYAESVQEFKLTGKNQLTMLHKGSSKLLLEGIPEYRQPWRFVWCFLMWNLISMKHLQYYLKAAQLVIAVKCMATENHCIQLNCIWLVCFPCTRCNSIVDKTLINICKHFTISNEKWLPCDFPFKRRHHTGFSMTRKSCYQALVQFTTTST